MWRFVVLLMCVPAWAIDCDRLGQIRLNHATVSKSETITSGTFTPAAGSPLTNLPAFCRVAVTARPSKDSEIAIEIWMPQMNWNGRLEGTGNGGFAGRISYASLANGVKSAYAVANTDMGMATPENTDASVFVNRPERWADWGYRATHEMTIIAKQIVIAFYGKPLNKAYFVGCSTGGEQALMEAQRFPTDYDGIVGGAPAHNRTGVHTDILWNFAAVERDPAGYIPPEKLPLITNAVNAACDQMDGVKDGVIADPTQCRFDPASLQCSGSDSGDCLTDAQVKTVRLLYDGPVNPHTGAKLYPGLPRGSEFGWDRLGPRPELAKEPPFAPIFKWVFGLQWDWRSFDFDTSSRTMQKKLASTLNATDPNLDRFRQHGGKLLLYHGWSDWLVAPEETIHYYDAVHARDTAGNVNTSGSVRLFMMPGMAHCGGGPGADQFDALGAVVRWVEDKAPPTQLQVSKREAAVGGFRRIVCPYPQVAVYQGSGDPNDDASYQCAGSYLSARK